MPDSGVMAAPVNMRAPLLVTLAVALSMLCSACSEQAHRKAFWVQFESCIWYNAASDEVFYDILRAYPDFVRQPTLLEDFEISPLQATIFRGFDDRAIILIRYNSDLNYASTYNGFTPLHFAAAYDKRGLVAKYLLAYGAAPEARDVNGRTALDLARKQRNAAVVAVLGQWQHNPAGIVADVRKDLSGRIGWWQREYEKAERAEGKSIRGTPMMDEKGRRGP